jgi:hypothetical protein
VEVLLWFAVQNSKFGHAHPGFGEQLSLWSVPRFLGFILSGVGIVMCNRFLELAFLKYPPRPPSEEDVRGQMGGWLPNSRNDPIALDSFHVVEFTGLSSTGN